MRPPLSAKFVEKAEAALVAAIEIYNKPSFRYREETFSLLAINAWELLLRAQLLKRGNNDPKVIRVYEQRCTKGGKTSKKLYLKRNRAGAPLTLSLPACIMVLDKDADVRLTPEIKANLDALIAVRVVGNDAFQEEIGSQVGRRLRGETRGWPKRVNRTAEITL